MDRRWLLILPVLAVLVPALWWVRSARDPAPLPPPAVPPSVEAPAREAGDVEEEGFLVRVFDEDGQPVEGVGIRWMLPDGPPTYERTDARGEVRLEAAEEVIVTGTGGARLIDAPDDRTTRLSPERPQADYFVRAGCGLEVTVTDRRGRPLPARVTFHPRHRGWLSVIDSTGGDGHTSMQAVPCTEGRLMVSARHHTMAVLPVVGGQDPVTVELVPSRNVQITLLGREGALVTDGSVYEARTGLSIPADLTGKIPLVIDTEVGTELKLKAVGHRSQEVWLPPEGPEELTVQLEPHWGGGFRVLSYGGGDEVYSVDPLGPAAAAGLREGDVIRSASVAGMPVRRRLDRLDDVPGALPVTVVVERDGERHTLWW